MARRHALELHAALLAAAAAFATNAAAQSADALDARLDALEAQVVAAEDVAAIKRLQRQYGYYVDKGMWEDVADLYTADAVANYPAGTYVGHDSIRKHLYMNVGGGQVGENGLPDNRIYNHLNIQPVVHLEPGGQTAKGRWRAFAFFGTFGGGATWAEGIYEVTYAKVGGVWKISNLDYHSGFGAPYATGWVPPEPAAAGAAPRAAPRGSAAQRSVPGLSCGVRRPVPLHESRRHGGRARLDDRDAAGPERPPAERARPRRGPGGARATARRRAGSREPAKDLRLRSEEHTSELQSQSNLVCR